MGLDGMGALLACIQAFSNLPIGGFEKKVKKLSKKSCGLTRRPGVAAEDPGLSWFVFSGLSRPAGPPGSGPFLFRGCGIAVGRGLKELSR